MKNGHANGNGHHFLSPTLGKLSFEDVRKHVLSFIKKDPSHIYRLIIGTDSAPKDSLGADFVSAIVIHRVGHGGIYFWRRYEHNKQMVLRDRIYQEAMYSLALAHDVVKSFTGNGVASHDVEIHVDVGQKGETRDMIAELVGMIRGSGFTVKTKPDSFGASKVADRHT